MSNLNRHKGDVEQEVEHALRGSALWDEVKDKLKSSGLSLSGGQQQRICIARAITTEADVLLMDEPCSALDPIAGRRIEELMHELKRKFTIAIVTHNLPVGGAPGENEFEGAQADVAVHWLTSLIFKNVCHPFFPPPCGVAAGWHTCSP